MEIRNKIYTSTITEFNNYHTIWSDKGIELRNYLPAFKTNKELFILLAVHWIGRSDELFKGPLESQHFLEGIGNQSEFKIEQFIKKNLVKLFLLCILHSTKTQTFTNTKKYFKVIILKNVNEYTSFSMLSGCNNKLVK